jgi:site-specific DNA recombinase
MTNSKIQQQSRAAPKLRCAIYTRKSTEEGLDQEFNSLDAQRESGEAYIKSQAQEGWECLPDRYDDGGYTGGNLDRPAVQRLLADIKAGKIDVVVVYKVDRLSRSLLDFAKMLELFEKYHVAFVSVTQQFNTTTSMGRLMLNVLLSFAQFEREIISERTKDKIAATRRKGKYSGGMPLLGYDVVATKLVVVPDEAEQVRQVFGLYLESDGLIPVVQELERRGWRNKRWTTKKGIERGGRQIDKNALWHLLTNVTYIGKVRYKDEVHDGEHQSIINNELWQQVQSKLQKHGRTGGAEVRNKFGALLKGLLHCTPCRCAMTPSHSTRDGNKRYRYYICSAAQKRGWQTCPTPSIPAGEIERFVVEQIKGIGRDPQLVAETIRQVHAQATQGLEKLTTEERRLTHELRLHHGELQKLAVLPNQGDGLATARLADVQERIGGTEQRLTEIRNESEGMRHNQIDEDYVGPALAEFDPVWESLSPREQQRLLQLLIERIDFDGSDGMISITFHAGGLKTLANQTSQGDAA